MFQSQLWSNINANRETRSGLTVMEVLIAIGVILVGLLGISALIPIAAEDANASIRVDAAIRYGASITSELRARDVGALGNYFRRDADPRNDDFLGINNATVPKPIGLGVPNDSPSMRFAAASLGAPRSGVLASYCIDPLLLSQNQSPSESTPSPTSRSAYDTSRFPYYNEYYSGLTQPNNVLAMGSGFPFPRMWRVAPPDPTSVGPSRFVSPAVAWRLSSSESELSFVDADDRLDPIGQLVNVYQYSTSGDPTSGIASVASRRVENRYSWFATLTPPLDGGATYKLSTVVVEQRGFGDVPSRIFQDPFPVRSDRDNFSAEKLAWIGDAVSLGSTTEVEVYGNEMVSEKIVSNQWVMLSAQPTIVVSGTVIPAPTVPAVHRWFRVLQVGPASVEVLSGENVWRRRVVLDGPEWSFNLSDGSMLNDTFMTIVPGAVAVIESDIRVR